MLTPKQEAFCLAYIETGNASDACRRAYNTKKMLPATVNRMAKELLDNPKIATRIATVKGEHLSRHSNTVDGMLLVLDEIQEKALKDSEPKLSVAINAIMGKVKLLGLDSIIREKREAEQYRREVMRELISGFRNGEIDFVDVLSECAVEGIPVPDVINLIEQQNILKDYKAKKISAIEAQERLVMCRMQPQNMVARDASLELSEMFDQKEIEAFKRIKI